MTPTNLCYKKMSIGVTYRYTVLLDYHFHAPRRSHLHGAADGPCWPAVRRGGCAAWRCRSVSRPIPRWIRPQAITGAAGRCRCSSSSSSSPVPPRIRSRAVTSVILPATPASAAAGQQCQCCCINSASATVTAVAPISTGIRRRPRQRHTEMVLPAADEGIPQCA